MIFDKNIKKKCPINECDGEDSIFHERLHFTIKQCQKCKEETELFREYNSNHIYCKRCLDISLNGTMGAGEFWGFIWWESIEYKGLDWYKKARDKLIEKNRKEKELRNNKELLKKQRIVKAIEKGWKNVEIK